MDDFSTYIPAHENGKRCLRGLYFNTPSNIAKSLYFYPLWGAEYQVSYPYSINRQYMDSFIIFLIEDGELNFHFKDQKFTARKHNIVLLDCKDPNYYYTQNHCKFVFIHFRGPQSQQLYDYVTDKGATNKFPLTTDIEKTVFSLLKELQPNHTFQEEIYYSEKLYSILLALTKIKDEVPLDRSTLRSTPALIKSALAYLDEHYMEKITISKLCMELGTSPSLLSMQFRAYTSNSIHQYLASVRLSHAEHLLTNNPDLSIANVANLCGFHDASHLNKAFKSSLRMAPSQFRSQCF